MPVIHRSHANKPRQTARSQRGVAKRLFEVREQIVGVLEPYRHANQAGSDTDPLLFVEVLSPGTARYDRVVKRGRYQRYGVEYWIADLDARLVERWTPASDRPEMITGTLTWHPAGASEALTIDLDAVFAESVGER